MTAKNRIAKYLWTFIKYFSLILAGFIAVLPVASCVITAFKTPEEYASTNVMTLPFLAMYIAHNSKTGIKRQILF